MQSKLGLNEYQKICQETAIPHTDKEKELMNWGLGISGEAGDVASLIKKTIAHKNPQIEGIKENLGDTLWYISMICNHFNWDLNDIITMNVEKLRKRFPNGFSFENIKRTPIDWNENKEV